MAYRYFWMIGTLLTLTIGAARGADHPAGPTPYPASEKDWPGKGVIRTFGFMVGERKAIWARREADQGAIVFIGDSLTGGWKNLAADFPKLKVANCGVGGDVSRGALFRFKEDVLDRNPRAIVIEIGNNDLTAMGSPADMLSNVSDMLAMTDREKPGTPVVLCSIPASANPKAPVKADDRKAMNEGLGKLASERKNTYFCDLFSATANDDGSPKPEYFAADKLHLSDAGHQKWAELLQPILEHAHEKGSGDH
jgi:lysophospholipase L1-like esterase